MVLEPENKRIIHSLWTNLLLMPCGKLSWDQFATDADIATCARTIPTPWHDHAQSSERNTNCSRAQKKSPQPR